ncbi:hypothetical protein J6590_050749 [Homalodisca vitripennis]|nr:hypothetical protein J6590_050749 [Homalodisca vitripennis]
MPEASVSRKLVNPKGHKLPNEEAGRFWREKASKGQEHLESKSHRIMNLEVEGQRSGGTGETQIPVTLILFLPYHNNLSCKSQPGQEALTFLVYTDHSN